MFSRLVKTGGFASAKTDGGRRPRGSRALGAATSAERRAFDSAFCARPSEEIIEQPFLWAVVSGVIMLFIKRVEKAGSAVRDVGEMACR